MRVDVKLTIKSLIVLYSYHHNNTQKIADVFARILEAQIKTPQTTKPEALQDYDLVGFGSGIDGDKHYAALLEFADRLPRYANKKGFIFSTCALMVVFVC